MENVNVPHPSGSRDSIDEIAEGFNSRLRLSNVPEMPPMAPVMPPVGDHALRDMSSREFDLLHQVTLLKDMTQGITARLNTMEGPTASTPFSSKAGPPHYPTVATNVTRDIPPSPEAPRGPQTQNFSTFSQSYSKSCMRDALELVPKYDGHNMPIWQFTRACKRAKESIPLIDEQHLVS